MLPRSVTVGPLAAPITNGICLSQTPTGSGNLTLNGSLVVNGVAVLDTPRRILFTPAGAEGTNGTIWTVYGTDWNGNPVSESVVAVNAPSTVYTAYDYKTVTRIAVNKAQVGAVTVGTNGVASSMPIMLDAFAPAPTSVQVVVHGTVNYTVQQTLDDLNRIPGGYPNATWINHPDSALVNATGSVQSGYSTLPQFVRVTLNSENPGPGNYLTMTLIQADM